MATTRVPTWLWIASAAAVATWCALAYSLSAFSDALPELNRIQIRSAVLSTLFLPVAATLFASALPRRSIRRAVATCAGSLAFAAILVARQYWDETHHFTGERLQAARRQRQLEIVQHNRTDRDFAAAIAANARPAQSASDAHTK